MKVFLACVNIRLIGREHNPSRHILCTKQLVSVLRLMPNLVILDLTRNYHFELNGIDIVDILSRHCLFLEELNLSECLIPAKKLINLRKLAYLKRLNLDYLSYADTLYDDVPEHDTVACFKVFAAEVLPHLNNLEYLTIMDNDVALPADAIVAFIKNACPSFKVLRISTQGNMGDPYRDFEVEGDRHNFVEEALEKCQKLVKDNHSILRMVVDGLVDLHRNSCEKGCSDCSCWKDYLSYYEEIAPKFLQVENSNCEFNIQENFDSCQFFSFYGLIRKRNNGYMSFPRFVWAISNQM